MSGVSRSNFYSQIIYILFVFFHSAVATFTNSVFYFDYNFGLFEQNIFYYLYHFANGVIYIVFLLSILFLFKNTTSNLFRTFVMIFLIIYISLAAGLYVVSLSKFGSNLNINLIDLVALFAKSAVWSFVLHAAMPKKDYDFKSFRILRNSMIASFSFGIIAVPIWSYLNPLIMTRQAENLASTDRYCLWVSELNNNEYRLVTQRRQLEGLRMQAISLDSERVDRFNAVMWVFRNNDVFPYSWSYLYHNFEPIPQSLAIEYRFPNVCNGKEHFLAHLE